MSNLPERNAGGAVRLEAEDSQALPQGTDQQVGSDGVLLPCIGVAGRQLREITADAIKALILENHPYRTFHHGDLLVRIEHQEVTGKLVFIHLRGKALRHHLARVADWFSAEKPTAPPHAVVMDLEASGKIPGIPVLEAVVSCPVITAEGDLISRPGYHPAARIWYQPDPGFASPEILPCPSQVEIQQARSFIEDNLLVNFPFVDQCDRAAAWAAMVEPFVRPAIDGPTPLYLFQAPTPGTGKTLLVHCLMVPSLGRQQLTAMTVDCEEAEIRKRLTSRLRESPTALLIDNLGQGRRHGSSSLASILTTRIWADRRLGSSAMVSLPVHCTFLGTGNNPVLSDEMVRRTISCFLDTRDARPHLRAGFKHREILVWARANRPALVHSILTLVQAWLAAGQPPGDVQLGMYESWSGVVSGVLEVAGVEGLNRSIQRYQRAASDTEQTVGPFVQAWWTRHGSARVGVKDLFDLARAGDDLEALLLDMRHRRSEGESKTTRGMQTRFGLALRRLTGQVYAGCRIVADGTDNSGRQMYRLVRQDVAEVQTLDPVTCQTGRGSD
jgi:hypothetical protein